MKKYILHIAVLTVVCLISSRALGEDKSGNINTTTISGVVTWNLTGDITITGQITINSGGNLTITGNSKTIKAYTNTSSTPNSFLVKDGGVLTIKDATVNGNNSGDICNVVGELAVQTYPNFTNSGRFILINDRATVNMTNVNVHHLYGKNDVCFIQLAATNANTSTVSQRASLVLDGCSISNCLNDVDNGIIHQSGESMHANITIKNSSISNCMIRTNGYGGVIKGAGKTDCMLDMYNSSMSNCWSPGWGGAVLWAASGSDCYANFEKCTFSNNYARYLGGAISSEATVKLVGCTLKQNIAGYGGGAIAAFPFTLATGDESTDISTAIGLTLSDNKIFENKTLYSTNKDGVNVPSGITPATKITHQAEGYFNPCWTNINATDVYYPTGGGALWILMNRDGWNCSLEIGNNEIYSNHSANNAGGILLFKQKPYSSTSKTYLDDYSKKNGNRTGVTSMSLGATIYNNTAINNGGGVSIGASESTSKEWSLPSVTLEGGSIYSNSAVNGAGIYMPGGVFNVNGGTLYKNTATDNGGGIYLSSGAVTINANKEFSAYENTAKSGGGIYMGGGAFTVNGNASFTKNKALKPSGYSGTCNGGAVFLINGTFVVGNSGNIIFGGDASDSGNSASDNGGGLYCDGAFTVNGNSTMKYNSAKNGGAIYVNNANLTTTKTTIITDNYSTSAGGAIYVNSGDVVMNATTLHGNYAIGTGDNDGGGAIYVKGGSFTTNGTTSITNNYATTDGGAVYVSGGTVSLNTPTITGNGKNGSTVETDKGGAVYVTGAGSSVTLDGVSTINGNSAQNGGAIYTTGNVYLKGNSTMENNVATADGGVIYVDGGNISSLNSGSDYFSVTANNNSAVNGGAFRVNGSIEFGYTLMSNNTASANGGAVALYNGTFSMKNDDGAGNKSNISNNTASNYGGGLYIENSESSPVDITWNGGVFTNNKAKAGGAVSADGNIALTFAATMENNQAEIGGGLYINNGVDMNFGSGLVRGNSAIQPVSNTNTYTTSTGKDASNVSGVGGGIFMAKNSKLTFTNASELGIYNNFASNAGADICSNGDGTTITLPNVTNMQLTGFDVPGNKLYWMEDYFKGETYSSNVTSSSTSTGVRYEEILKDIITYDLDKYKIEFAQTNKSFSNYICLDLGYDLVYVNFTVEGLDKGDVVAIICNYPKDDDYVQYRKVLFVGNGTLQPVTKQISLPSGYWNFAASDWSYNYNEPVIFRANETTAHTGDIFISRKDSDKDANGYDVAGFRVVKAKFETKTPEPGSTEPNKYNVKQSQSVKVNRMGKKVTNN